MAMNYGLKLKFESESDYGRACGFLVPRLDKRDVIPDCEDQEMTITFSFFSGICETWHKEMIVQLAEAFPDMPFCMTSWDDQANFWWAYNKNGTMTFVDHHDEIYEMMWRWQIDINETNDPFLGPTEDAWAELKHCRDQHVQEMIDMGIDIAPGTWPPTQDQEDEWRGLRKSPSDPTDLSDADDLPF